MLTVAACNIVNNAANMLTMSNRKFLPIFIKDVEFTVDIILHQQQSLLEYFLAVAVNQLDNVVVVRVLADRNHDAAVKVIHTGDVDH